MKVNFFHKNLFPKKIKKQFNVIFLHWIFLISMKHILKILPLFKESHTLDWWYKTGNHSTCTVTLFFLFREMINNSFSNIRGRSILDSLFFKYYWGGINWRWLPTTSFYLTSLLANITWITGNDVFVCVGWSNWTLSMV